MPTQMNVVNVKISDIKTNPNNPRLIKDDKFAKLVQSIKDFPEMLQIRPIVVNSDMVVLGGNMRLKACKEAGLKEIPIIRADQLTEDQQREFIIKDNVGFGEWEWEMIRADWDVNELTEWGLDVPDWDEEIKENNTDLSDSIDVLYKIEIECINERDQEQTYNKLIGEGYKCRILTL